MDDQRAHREGGGGLAAKSSKRFQFTVRLMLLVVALICPLCTLAGFYYRSYLAQRREILRHQLIALENEREAFTNRVASDQRLRPLLGKAIAAIAEKKRELGEN
jgi:hypothetical protein